MHAACYCIPYCGHVPCADTRVRSSPPHACCPDPTIRLGYEVELTTVALAFGVHEPQPTQKEVFAFLPVRRCGLNFVLQGDFVVPSSRGDIDCDDPFNQLLHSKVRVCVWTAACGRQQEMACMQRRRVHDSHVNKTSWYCQLMMQACLVRAVLCHVVCLQVAGLFAASFAKFKAMPPPKGESQLFWIDWWCRCVPLPDQLHVSVQAAGTGQDGWCF